MKTPHYHLVPKDLDANIAFRRELLRIGSSDPAKARQLKRMCAEDILFCINAFHFTYDPRSAFRAVPFITYPYQDDAITGLCDTILSPNRLDELWEKSRDMGASWMCITVFEWLWRFYPMMSFLLGSRKEEYVDLSGDPKTLFWKIDFIHQNTPEWLLPKRTRALKKLINDELSSTISGEATNKDFGRGDRRTAILLDEFAAVEQGKRVLSAVADVTKHRIFNSTHQGTDNAFYYAKSTFKDLKTRSFHWTAHPEKARGLYHDEDGKPRSPWYDEECKVRAPWEIAQELDMSPYGSVQRFFSGEMVEEKRTKSQPPYKQVGINLDVELMTAAIDPKGNELDLWVLPDARMQIPSGRDYVVSCDVAHGTGATNSVITVFDRTTGEQVAEFASPHIQPHELAKKAIALCKWFGGGTRSQEGAYLIWEANGPGRIFEKSVIELGYTRFYRDWADKKQGVPTKKSKYAGFWNQGAKDGSKMLLLSNYERSLREDRVIVRSDISLRECDSYVYMPDGSVAHEASRDMMDPSGAKINHADRVIACALGAYILNNSILAEKSEEPQLLPGTFAWRQKRRRRAEKPKRALVGW